MLLAYIFLYECDDCKAIIKCQDESEFKIYEASWHDGLLAQFCPKCKTKTENQDKILRDKNFDFYISNLGEETDVKPEFIN